MKILVLSDSHSGLKFMHYCIGVVKPDHIIHLGDYYDDGKVIAEDYPHLQVHQVPGNGDCARILGAPLTMCYDIGGVRIFMTHGHMYGIKSGDLDRLLADAKQKGAQVVAFGHTHEELCFRTEAGIWVLNPGSCRSWSGSAGVIEITGKKVSACYVVKQAELELMQEQEEKER